MNDNSPSIDPLDPMQAINDYFLNVYHDVEQILRTDFIDEYIKFHSNSDQLTELLENILTHQYAALGSGFYTSDGIFGYLENVPRCFNVMYPVRGGFPKMPGDFVVGYYFPPEYWNDGDIAITNFAHPQQRPTFSMDFVVRSDQRFFKPIDNLFFEFTCATLRNASPGLANENGREYYVFYGMIMDKEVRRHVAQLSIQYFTPKYVIEHRMGTTYIATMYSEFERIWKDNGKKPVPGMLTYPYDYWGGKIVRALWKLMHHRKLEMSLGIIRALPGGEDYQKAMADFECHLSKL